MRCQLLGCTVWLVNTASDAAVYFRWLYHYTDRFAYKIDTALSGAFQPLCHRQFNLNESGPGDFIQAVNTLRPRQNGRHVSDGIFKRIFLNENVWISLKIWLKFVPKVWINNIPALIQIMAWRRPGDKPLSGPMMLRLPTHICVTRPQWVKWGTLVFLTHWPLGNLNEILDM